MKRIQRAAAWLLCTAMLVSDQGMQTLAASNPVWTAEKTEKTAGESYEKATPGNAEEAGAETGRIEAILPLQPLDEIEWDGDAAIYWNPGRPVEWEGETATSSNAFYQAFQEETDRRRKATSSDAEVSTPSDAEWMPQGSDQADGLTPGRPVKSLGAAIAKAKKLAKKLDMEMEDVVIYAMNPMEIREGEAYFLNGKDMTIMAWDGRDYDSDLIFYVDGGQLTLKNVKLQPSGGAGSETSVSVVQADRGKVQIGKQVELSGAVALNYQETKETPEWLLTDEEEADAALSDTEKTGGKATPSGAEKDGPETDEMLKPVETETGAPVVELLKDFDGEFGPYYLDVQADDDLESVELVRSLYADDTTADEFMEQFYFSDMTDIRWEMEVYQEAQGVVRKAESSSEDEDGAQAEENSLEEETEEPKDGAQAEENSLEEETEKPKNGAQAEENGLEEETEEPKDGAQAEENSLEEETEEPKDVEQQEKNGLEEDEEEQAESEAKEHEKKASLTRKRLVARASEGELVYWNPGAAIEINGESYGAGDDSNGGTYATYPVRTWKKALEIVRQNGGTIVAVRTLNLDPDGNAVEFIGGSQGGQGGENAYRYVFDGELDDGIRVRSVSGEAVFRVEEGASAEFSDLIFTGADSAGPDGATAVEASGGEIVLRENVRTERAYLQVNLEKKDNEDEIPVQVCSEDVEVTLYFGGINDNLNKRFLDVVVPGGELAAQIEPGGNAQERSSADEVGKILLNNISLAQGNKKEGGSNYDWVLRQDGALDDQQEYLQNLELYTDYYYDAVYLNGVSGDDGWLGASCQYPVKTFARAKEILEQEIEKSREARQEAADEGKAPQEIAIPTKIYICGTVDAAGEQRWELSDYPDYDGSPVKVEIVSHAENIAENTEGTPVHDKPETLVRVSENGKLTLGKGILIRNVTDLAGSSTVEVNAGGTLAMADNAVLTGSRDNMATDGIHISVKGNEAENGALAAVTMEETWTGAVESRGVGILADGKQAIVTMEGGAVQDNDSSGTQTDGYGAGIVCQNGAKLVMEGGEIKNNTSRTGGAGVLIGTDSSFEMRKGKITGNTVAEGKKTNLYGGGIYIQGDRASFVMGEAGSPDSNCVVSGNRLSGSYTQDSKGGGIAFASAGGTFTFHSGEVTGNSVGGMNGYGGGIAVTGGIFDMRGGAIRGNRVDATGTTGGGGAAIMTASGSHIIQGAEITGNTGSSTTNGAGLYAKLGDNGRLDLSDSSISGNTGGNGGGVYVSSGTVYLKGDTVDKNTAQTNGGGIYTGDNGKCFAEDTEISENKNSGIYVRGSFVGRSVRINRNSSDNSGGGVFVEENGYFQLTDMEGEEPSEISGNRADADGGGLYIPGTGSAEREVYISTKGTIQNSAAKRGNNIYLEGGSVYLLSGTLEQPQSEADLTETDETVFNVYLNRAAGAPGAVYIDPAKVSIETTQEITAGNGAKPDAVYLNSPDSYLTYLSEPEGSTYKLPLTLNRENFSVGSIAAKPVGSKVVSLKSFPEAARAARMARDGSSYSYTCGSAYDPREGDKNFHYGSETPLRTQLSGFTEGEGKTELVLVGEGIYLDGENGSNANTGLSPQAAVRDFATAKEKLEAQVTEANQVKDGEGFSPFIYISGPVTVDETEIWDLEYDEKPYQGSRYEEFEKAAGRTPEKAQVRRFASFTSAPMVTVESTGAVKADTLIVNGMKDSVLTSEQKNLSPVFQITEGNLSLGGKAVVRDNYYNLIIMDGGKLVLDGSEASGKEKFNQLEIRSHGYGVYADNKAQVEMKNGARIYMEDAKGSTISNGKEYPASALDEYWQGVVLGAGSKMTVEDSFILQANTEKESQNGVGVVMGTLMETEAEQTLTLTGTSSISGFGKAVGLKPYGANIYLKDESVLEKNGSAVEVPGGTNRNAAGNIEIHMTENSRIQNSGKGIVINDSNSSDNAFSDNPGAGKILISLQNNAAIHSCQGEGIYIYNNKNLFEVQMKDESSIDGNNGGIYGGDMESSKDALVSMAGNASVSGNKQYGVYLENTGTEKRDSKLLITLRDQSQISGNGTNASGNQLGGGVYVYKVNCEIKMTDDALLSENGCSSSQGSDGGIVFDLRSGNDYTGIVSLEGNAAVKDSRGPGIWQVVTAGSSDNQGTLKVSLSGESSVQGSAESDIQMEAADGELRLSGNAVVGAESAAHEKQDSILLKCPLYLEGTAVVNGMIYLKNVDAPIVMTKLVPEGEEKGRYKLHLAEEFVGQKVVIPEKEDTRYPEEEEAEVTDVSGQLPFFVKEKGDGLAGAEERVLLASGTDIILFGENNVYLSGKGNDANNGLTPQTAVRTFKRAKELLERDGYFKAGADILITSGVKVEEGDEVWSFDENSQATNIQSGETWTPVVRKYEEFSGSVSSYTSHLINPDGRNVRLEHITVGDSTFDYSDADLYVDNGVFVIMDGSVTLGEGAVLRNLHGVNCEESSQSMIYILGGTFVIEGGIIENCSLEGEMNEWISCSSNGNVRIEAGAIRGNNLYESRILSVGRKAAVSINGGLISGNQTESYLISLEDEAAGTFSGGSVEGNQADMGTIHLTGEASLSMTGGSIRNNRSEKSSSAVGYEGTGAFEISGGTISGNTVDANKGQAVEEYSPIYIKGTNFRLKGGNANISDAIYLADTDNLIALSGPIYQKDRVYTVYLNREDRKDGSNPFLPGSAVVQPDGNWLSDATPYLGNFRVISAPYILDQGQSEKTVQNGNQAFQENQCLILMKAVFADGEKGNDENGGTNPSDAVATFGRAKTLGGTDNGEKNDYYVIYVSGPVYAEGGNGGEEEAGNRWTLPDTAYLCRYTGFAVYDEEGQPVSGTGEGKKGYTGELIEIRSGENLVLGEFSESQDGGSIHIYGRRGIDSDTYNGESLLLVKNGARLEIQDAVLSRNSNTDTESGDYEDALSQKGGAVHVEEGASLKISGGTFTGLNAVYGGAVYLAGELTLENSPLIQEDVYLAKRESAAASGEGAGAGTTFIQVDANYIPSGYNKDDSGTKLSVRVEDDFNGRKVIEYPDDAAPTPDQMDYYRLDDYILSVYDFLQNPDDASELTLQKRQAYFLDGKDGDDENDGTVPDRALKNLGGLYEKLRTNNTAGAVVYVVNGVEVKEGDDFVLLNYIYQEESDGVTRRVYKGGFQSGEGKPVSVPTQVTFMRYVRPDGAEETEGFENAVTCTGPLFQVSGGGKLSLNGVYLDGGLNGVTYLIEDAGTEGQETRLTAEACENAEGPLISVSGETSSLTLAQATDDQIGALGDKKEKAGLIPTTLRNNQNLTAKLGEDHVLGKLNGEYVYEGSSAGVEILSGADCTMDYTEFSNLSISQSATGGTDVYDNGELLVKASVHITGSIFLEGQGNEKDKETQKTSRFIKAEQTSGNWKEPFQLKLRDPYFGRTMIAYPGTIQDNDRYSMVGYYILEEMINDYFRLGIRESDRTVYELTPPPAVYINGQNGKDDIDGEEGERLLGTDPSHPVKTLQKAYELMKNRAVNILYVVNTVEVTDAENLTNTSYYSDNGDMQDPITLQNHLDKVEIRRYVKPLAAEEGDTETKENYSVPSFEDGPLFLVKAGGSLSITAEDGFGIDIDGHKNPRTNEQESNVYRTEERADSSAPLIEVEENGTLYLEGEGVVLHDNKNVTGEQTAGFLGFGRKTIEGTEGGAIYNGGEVRFAGAVLKDNEARHGAGVYQDGTFTITVSQPTGLVGQEIYLTSERLGAGEEEREEKKETKKNGETQETGQWGTDHVINSDILLDESFVETAGSDSTDKAGTGAGDSGTEETGTESRKALFINMDNAVKGRHVIVYNSDTGVDEQHNRYSLGETVPEDLFLVESPTEGEENILELQNWEILDVTVPKEIFLAVQSGKDSGEHTGEAAEDATVISDGASSEPELRSAVYGITNNGPQAVRVSLTGFIDTSEETGAKAVAEDAAGQAVSLVSSREEAAGEENLYLAVKGADGTAEKPQGDPEASGDGEIGSHPFEGLEETPLAHYGEDGSGSGEPAEMGVLSEHQTGYFQFTGQASEAFIDAYADSEFPLEGAEHLEEARKDHYRTLPTEETEEGEDGQTAGEKAGAMANHARASYRMEYRIELAEPRR